MPLSGATGEGVPYPSAGAFGSPRLGGQAPAATFSASPRRRVASFVFPSLSRSVASDPNHFDTDSRWPAFGLCARR